MSETFFPVIPSFMSQTSLKNSGYTYSQVYTVQGVVSAIYPPSDPLNKSKAQYEYLVDAVGETNSHLPLHCILSDRFGGNDDYEVFSLRINQRVTVQCVLGNPESAIIIGGMLNTGVSYPEDRGHHWISRFNKITRNIDKSETYSVKHDDGTEIRVEKAKVVIRDGAKNEITIDKAAAKITISDGAGESIEIDQKTKKITVNAKDMQLNIKGNLTAKVTGDADIKAKTIKLNGSKGTVVTSGVLGTYKRDYITGIPIRGVKNVKAG